LIVGGAVALVVLVVVLASGGGSSNSDGNSGGGSHSDAYYQCLSDKAAVTDPNMSESDKESAFGSDCSYLDTFNSP
jgi:hypothetical protein